MTPERTPSPDAPVWACCDAPSSGPHRSYCEYRVDEPRSEPINPSRISGARIRQPSDGDAPRSCPHCGGAL
jgi:hypothetical protein